MAIEVSEFCTYAQIDMVDAVKNNTLAQRQKTGLLSALLSSQNVSAQGETIPVAEPGRGRVRMVDVRYIQPQSEADSTSGAVDPIDSVCEAGEPIVDLYDRVTIDLSIKSAVIELDEAQMRTMCERTFNERRMKYINGMMDSMLRGINAGLITQYAAGVGGFMDGVAAGKDIEMLDGSGSNTTVLPMGEITMIKDYEDAGALGKPIAIGGGNLYTYTKLTDIGCCNDVGQQIDRLGNFDYFYDNQIASVLGPSAANDFFLLQPGAAQFLSVNFNEGEFVKRNDLFVHDTIVDPVSGLTFDYYQKYDECAAGGPVYRIFLQLRYALWQMPLDMFKDADARDGINFTFQYTATAV